jgi:hypothetical protein
LVGKLAAVYATTLLAAACGRIGYDEQGQNLADATPGDGSPPDTPAASCPSDTRPIAGAVVGTTCIEIDERGNATWLMARSLCTNAGRRLCTDVEWLLACQSTSGLVNMAGGLAPDWEWMADEAGGIALKRGFDLCTDESSHEIDNGGYDFRCCLDL